MVSCGYGTCRSCSSRPPASSELPEGLTNGFCSDGAQRARANARKQKLGGSLALPTSAFESAFGQRKKTEWACKPGFVVQALPGGRPFLWEADCSAPLAAYPEVVTGRT